MYAPTKAPNVPISTMIQTTMPLRDSGLHATYTAGGTTTSDGKGMKELSNAINRPTVV